MRYVNVFRVLAVFVSLVVVGCGSSPNSANSSGGNAAASGAPAAATEPAPAPAPPPIVLDAGTTITVTLDQSLSSETSNPGDRFDASLARPLMEHGEEVVPSGARVSGEVTEAKSAGRFKGGAELVVALKSINLHGRNYPLHTTTVKSAGKGRGKRTAIGVGGGAAAGAIIGAIAGGGKGAAIGAAAGGGAGTAGAALTGKRGIVIPAETRLSFKLIGPLQVD
jgi:hypothetical protein